MITKGLCEISSPKQWKTISTDMLIDSGYPVYGANGIIGFYSEYNHESETLLITCRGATCGSLNICVPYSYVNGNAMAIDNLSNEVSIKYLYYFLLHRGLDDVITGSAQPQIVRQSLEKVLVSYPSLAEQDRIVANLEVAENLISLRKQQLAKLDELVKARFVEMFGDPVSNPKRWAQVPLAFCLESIENGRSFVCESISREGDWPAVLKLSAATYGDYRPEENKAVLEENHFIESAVVRAGDLLFTRKNTPELVGMCAYVYETPPRLMMPDLIFRLNTKDNCNKMFLWKLINHDLFRERISNISTGSAKSMSNISKERLMELTIYLPPLELQHQFAAFVSQTDQQKLTIQHSLDKMETLKKALMQKYFG